MSEAKEVVELIREVGVFRLGMCDGCICCHFSVRNVDVYIACGKGVDRGIWVSSQSMSYDNGEWGDGEPLNEIAEEVHRQVEGSDMRGPIPVHLTKRVSDGQTYV